MHLTEKHLKESRGQSSQRCLWLGGGGRAEIKRKRKEEEEVQGMGGRRRRGRTDSRENSREGEKAE